MDTDTILDHYITAALWSSTDENGTPLDRHHDADDLASETREQMRVDVCAFVESVKESGLDVSAISDEQMGHDFWLTRNHHGAGFWDRGWEGLGDSLTTIAQSYGSFDLYIGDDWLIYGS